jgi:hypothetical protein
MDQLQLAYLKDVAYDIGLEHGNSDAKPLIAGKILDALGISDCPEETSILVSCYDEGFMDGRNLIKMDVLLIIIDIPPKNPDEYAGYDGAPNRDDYGSHPLKPPYGP